MPVGRDRGAEAGVVPPHSGGAHADPRGRAAPKIPDEDVSGEVRVVTDQVRGERVEGDVAPVGGDRGVPAIADLFPLRAGGAHADPRGRAGRTVSDEDIGGDVRVAVDQVRGIRLEGDEASVGGDRGIGAVAVPRHAGRAHADTRDRAGLPIPDENVAVAPGSATDQVRRPRFEGNEAPVRGDRGTGAAGVPPGAGGAPADPSRLRGDGPTRGSRRGQDKQDQESESQHPDAGDPSARGRGPHPIGLLVT